MQRTAEAAEKFVMLLKATTKARRHEESQRGLSHSRLVSTALVERKVS